MYLYIKLKQHNSTYSKWVQTYMEIFIWNLITCIVCASLTVNMKSFSILFNINRLNALTCFFSACHIFSYASNADRVWGWAHAAQTCHFKPFHVKGCVIDPLPLWWIVGREGNHLLGLRLYTDTHKSSVLGERLFPEMLRYSFRSTFMQSRSSQITPKKWYMILTPFEEGGRWII